MHINKDVKITEYAKHLIINIWISSLPLEYLSRLISLFNDIKTKRSTLKLKSYNNINNNNPYKVKVKNINHTNNHISYNSVKYAYNNIPSTRTNRNFRDRKYEKKTLYIRQQLQQLYI